MIEKNIEHDYEIILESLEYQYDLLNMRFSKNNINEAQRNEYKNKEMKILKEIQKIKDMLNTN